MNPRPLVDGEARRRIREDLQTTLVVEAAAGTGKTTELVSRIMALLRTGETTLSRIVAVTFTEKAAGEMKLRLRGEVEKARKDPGVTEVERDRITGALAELEAAHIGTIHSFCADLLRERPIEAAVDPLFEVAAEDEMVRLYDETFETWFQQTLSHPGEGVRRILRRRGRDAGGPKEVLRKAGAQLIEQRDFDTPWRLERFGREQAIDHVFAMLDRLGHRVKDAQSAQSYLVKNLIEVKLFVEEVKRREEVRGRDHDGLEAELRTVARMKSWGWKGSGQWYGRGIPRSEVVAQRDETKAALDTLLARADAELAACLFEEMRPLVAAYEGMKKRAGKLDFLDLLMMTRDLVRRDPAVREDLQERFSHLLVDEFQDTDPLQAEILLLLSADDPRVDDYREATPRPGKLFVVGDPKQSIYRFRRADVSLYETIKRRLVARGASVLHLSTSFRSVPAIQQAVNAAFEPLMQGAEDGGQASYVALEAFRDDPSDRPSIVALPVPRPYTDWGKVASYKIEDSIPHAVGAFVHWLLNASGWTTVERDNPSERVPIEARHVCLLFKRFQSFGRDVTRDYVRALEARRVPHVLMGGRSYHSREEVEAIRNALTAIEWPDDELAVYATLRGPFFAIGDDALLAFRPELGPLNPVRPLDLAKLSELTRPIGDALGILKRLHRGRNRLPIADTIAQLLEATRAHAGIAIWPTGEQALANILRVMDLARRFEAQGATSFRAFVVRLQDDADRGGAAEAPVVEEGTDGVRIMTVHRAKGLEFPVVILVDPTAPATSDKPSRHVDADARLWAMPLAGCSPIELFENSETVLRHDQAEAVRLLYVAATRAKDLLVVPVVGDEMAAGWVDPLHPVLYPEHEARRDSALAPGCPPFGEDSVLERPHKAERDANDSVRPGLHVPRAGQHTVVFWDPHALALDRAHDVGLRQQRILEADEGSVVADESKRAHDEWSAKNAEVRARGSVPTLAVRTVTEARAALDEAAIPVAHDATDAPRSARPRGKRFGTLVHAVLSSIDLTRAPDGESLRRIAMAEGRLVGATPEEVDAACAAVAAALRHSLFTRARAEGVTLRRESPVLLREEDGAILEGVLDFALREIEGGRPIWTVVDFKTDAELAARGAEYEAQVAAYARAVRAATGEDVRGLILRV